MSKRLFGCLCLALCAVASANAGLLGTYSFTGSDPGGDASTPTGVANFQFGQFSRVNVGAVSAATSFKSDGWEQTASQNLSEYVQFTLTPINGQQFTFEEIRFNIQRSSQGPLNGEVRIFLGTPSADTTAPDRSQTFSPGTTPSTVTWNFADLATGANQPITIRFYGWNSANLQGDLLLDEVQIYGTVATPVPEPVNVALGIFGLAAVGTFFVRRFRKLRRA